MNTKKGIIGITLAAIMVASIFGAIAPSTTADVRPLADLMLKKTTYNCTTSIEEPLAKYRLGDTVCYWMRITYPGATYWTGNTYDDYPNTTTETLETGLFLNSGQNKSYYRNYTVTAADVTKGYILNTFRVVGKDGLGDDASGSVGKNNTVLPPEKKPPEFDFTWDVVCCRNLSFSGTSSDPANISNHTWNFGDGTSVPRAGAPDGNPITHEYADCSPIGYIVTLSGYCTQGLYNFTKDVVYANCDPTVVIEVTPPCYEAEGTIIEFNGSKSFADTFKDPTNNITWWKWTFSDGNPGTNDSAPVTSRWVNDTVTATLEVSDGHCNRTKSVTVNPCPWMSDITLYYDLSTNGGDGDRLIDVPEVINAVMDYLTDTYPFGPGGLFDKYDLCNYLITYIDQEEGFYGEADQISEYYDLPSNGGDGDGRIDPQELEQAILDCLIGSYPFGPGDIFNVNDLLAYLFEGICMPTTIYVPDDYTKIQWAVDNATEGDTIIVKSGTYYESVNVNKQLILRGMDTGIGLPVVDAGRADYAFSLPADGNILTGFTATNASLYGIHIGANNATIANNAISNISGHGIHLDGGSTNNTITNNTIGDISGYGNALWYGYGISLFYSSNNTFSGNTIVNISGSLLGSPEGSGIALFYSSNNTFNGNTITNTSKHGIYLEGGLNNPTSNNTLSGNSISNVAYGIYLGGSSDNTLSGNTINDTVCGIKIGQSSSNTLSGNTISNGHYGFQITDSSGNTIYLNDFINNTNNVYSYDSTNIWNSTSLVTYSYNGKTHINYLGNYWDDYTDTDADGDGIWDNPYSINSDQDYYPLVEGFENYTIPYPDWTIYTPLNSGLPNYPQSIAIDEKGNAWIGTFNGLVKFDGTNWTIYHVSNPRFPYGCFLCDSVSSIVIDSDGSIWSAVGYLEGGSYSSTALAKFDGLNWTIFDPYNSGLPGSVNSIGIDASGNKWIGTHGYGLAKFDNTNWVIYNTSNSDLHTNYLTSGLAIDSAGNLWIGTQYGVAKFDGVNYWERYDPPQNLGFYPGWVTSIAIDQNDDKWVGTAAGLAKFDGNAWTVYDSTNVLPGDWVTSIAIDANDNKWIGITPSNNIWHNNTGGGLVKFDGSTWTVFTQANSGLPDDLVLAVTAAKNNEIWVGTNTALAIYKQVTSTNNPPNPPTHLKQLKSDSETKIPVGNTTDERIVVFKGKVSDPDGDKVGLQVELRNLNESGGQFDEAKGGLKESYLVASESEAIAFTYELIDAEYHWRARTIDEHGVPSGWKNFGGNDISEADFVVNQSGGQSDKENLIKSIEDLRLAMLYKNDYDVTRTAQTFTSVRSYQLAKKWADIFGPVLKTIEAIIQICDIPQKLLEFVTNPNSAWIKFKSSLEVVSFGLMFQGLEKSMDGFYTGLYGPPYTTAVKDMIKSADAAFSPIELFFDPVFYQRHIENDLILPPSYAQSPLLIPRKSGDISRNTIGSSNGALDARRSINKEFNILINDINSNNLPPDFQTDKVISELNELRGEIYKSCNQNVDVEYNTYLLDKGEYVPKCVQITMGAPSKYSELFVELCDNLATKLSLEIRVEAINAAESTTVIIRYINPTLGKITEIPLTIISVDGIKSELDDLVLYSTVEDEFYMLPQEMLISVQLESSNLWMIADDVNRYLRYQIGIEPSIPENQIDDIRSHLCSPGELRVYDSQSRVTGLVNGEVMEEIPYSDYYQSTVTIFFPSDSYCYEVAGTENGTYALDLTSIEDEKESYFSVANISIQNEGTHQYLINWTNFSHGEEVVVVRKDENGDGTFEENVTIILPVANFTHVPEGPVTYQSIIFNASTSSDSDGFIRDYDWNFGDGNSGDGLVTTHFYSQPRDYNVVLVVTDNDGALNFMGKTITIDPSFFDTYSRANPYPSISGTHNGTLTPSCNLTVSRLYTYPCSGTGGHTEYAKISNESWSIETVPWTGYQGDWHNLSFPQSFTLYANETYNYTTRTGSYPQIIHESPFNATGGTITCTSFEDVNGRVYYDWIPAIRLWAE